MIVEAIIFGLSATIIGMVYYFVDPELIANNEPLLLTLRGAFA